EYVERKLPFDDPFAQIPQVANFLRAETDAAQPIIRHGRYLRRRRKCVEQRLEARKDRCRGFRRQLLADDGASKRLERILVLTRGEAARPVCAHQVTQDRIAAAKQATRSSVVDGGC